MHHLFRSPLLVAVTAVLAGLTHSPRAQAITIEAGSGDTNYVSVGDSWEYFKGTEAPSTPAGAWKDPGFNPTGPGWLTGPSGFGYGDGDDTTVLDDMEDGYTSLFTRIEFTLGDEPPAIDLELVIDYDDGFIAYLNGAEVARSGNLPAGEPDHETTTLGGQNHEAGSAEVFNLGPAGNHLQAGTNVLAVAGFNASAGSSDFSLVPALRTRSSLVRNDDVLIVESAQLPLQGTVASAAAVSVRANGSPAAYESSTQSWNAVADLQPGRNHILVEALDAGLNVLESETLEVIYVPGANVVTGTLGSSTTWSGAYRIQGTLQVAPGAVLTIDPGTVVLLEPGASVEVRGQLLAQGTATDPITFTHYGDGTTWERLLFIQAQPSLLRHCVVEFADCEGDHKDYYDDDCNEETLPPGNRQYFQAVVALGCHLDIEDCLFHKLPDDSNNAEGDAIAIISDDPDLPPAVATANIRRCDFIGIGQGVHTRYAPLVIEECFFTGHNGDNDDIDLYGESDPPPLILRNVMIDPNDDDMINPTRCSAILIGNLIAGSNDHGIVLRDRSRPILINNLIYDCRSAGISVQNQCDALLINNTIADCGRGVRLFDHTNRWDPPYCLFPGSGKATLINCVIRNCPTPFDLDNSPRPEDMGSHVTVEFSNIEGGQAASSVSTNSTLTWGGGNIDAPALFVDASAGDYRLSPGSPSIDTGTLSSLHAPDLTTLLTLDFAGLPRVLDGDGVGGTAPDMGAHEYLLATADSNGDGIPDGWYHGNGIDPTDPAASGGNLDGDPLTNGEEWIADTDPGDPVSYFKVDRITLAPAPSLEFRSSSLRVYSLFRSSDLMEWHPVPGSQGIAGSGGLDTLSDSAGDPDRPFYRVEVRVP